MMICFAIGILGGIVYYACGRPMYYSRALVRLTILSLPVNSESGQHDGGAGLSSPGFAFRAFQHQLTSDLMQKRMGIRLGVASESDSPEGIREFAIPKVDILFVDADHMEIGVFSPYPHVVREYAKALIEEYDKNEREIRDTFRKTAIDAYIAEMEDYQAKLDEHLKKRQAFEQSTSLAQLYMQLNSVAHVPKDLVVTKERLRRMNEARQYTLEHDKDMDTVAKLSLLNSVRTEKPVDVGTIFRDAAGGPMQNSAPRAPGQAPVDIVVPGMVESLEPWQLLVKEQRQLTEELRRNEPIYQEGHAIMRELNTKLSVVLDKLKAELGVAQQRFDVELASVTEKLRSLEAKLPEYNEINAKYEKEVQDYGLMEQGQLNWKKAHSDLAMNVAKLEFGADRERVHMDFASMIQLRDANPVSPNKSKLLLIALGLGLGLAAGVPTALLFVDSSVNRLEQLEAQTGMKGLGVVPLTNSTLLEDIFRAPVLDSAIPSFLLENVRIIRNNLNWFSDKAAGSHVIMVTSARPGEGKTSLAANMAWSFHTMGERTLLVDCDLRRGRVAPVTKIDNDKGLSTLLTGKCSLEEVIVNSECEGLDVIPRGPIVSGATEILCQQKFEDLVNQWRSMYDRVILDTPPVLGLGETSGLQRVADGVVLVVRAHKTRTKDVTDATDMLHRAGANMFGFVLNAVDLSKLANHYNYYYYSPQYYEAMENPVAAV